MVIKIYPGFEKPILEKNIGGNNIPHGIDLYEILGVGKTASKGQIGKAFNNLSINEHPDKKGGVITERFVLLEKAKTILLNARDEYNHLINNEGWLDKTNNRKFRDEIIDFLKNKIVFYDYYTLKKYDGTTKYLPVELQNWKNEIQNATLASYEEINSYANLLIEIFNNCLKINTGYGDRIGFRLSEIVKSFSGLKSKTQIDQAYDKIIQKIHEEDDQNGTGNPNDRLKRQKVKEMKELANFSLLTERGEDKEYEEKILNAFAEKGKGLEETINNILKNVKNRIKNLFDKKQKDNELKPKRDEYIKKLHRLEHWDKLLEPWEQSHLEDKVNTVSENNDFSFNNCLTYAQYLIAGGYLRKYRANFWNKLEELTDLEKEDIIQRDNNGDKEKSEKVGERYEPINKKYSGIEPKPFNRLDGTQLVKMKLFLCYYKKEASFQWKTLMQKIASYGNDIDSGWTPSKQSNKLLKYQQNEAIKVIEKAINSKEKGKEDKILGINWKRRFEIEGDTEKKINAIREDFLDKITYYRNGNPLPWKGGKNLSPPPDTLKEEKEEAIAKILKEAFDNDPVIDKDKLEKDNQNWENDINNASNKEQINFIKVNVIKDIKNKRVKEKEKHTLDELISKAKKDENWNNYQNLKKLLKQIKKLQFSDLYKKNKSEIYDIEKRIKELNPEDFKNSIKNDFDEKIKNSGLFPEEISDKTKELIDEVIESGDLEKKTKAEEAIIQEGVNKKLNVVIVIVKQAIKEGNLTNAQKEELITKILECISENDYQKKAYQKQKNKVDKLLSELRGKTTEKQESPEFSWQKKIGIAAVISLSITILVAIAMKISAHRKRRNTQ